MSFFQIYSIWEMRPLQISLLCLRLSASLSVSLPDLQALQQTILLRLALITCEGLAMFIE